MSGFYESCNMKWSKTANHKERPHTQTPHAAQPQYKTQFCAVYCTVGLLHSFLSEKKEVDLYVDEKENFMNIILHNTLYVNNKVRKLTIKQYFVVWGSWDKWYGFCRNGKKFLPFCLKRRKNGMYYYQIFF